MSGKAFVMSAAASVVLGGAIYLQVFGQAAPKTSAAAAPLDQIGNGILVVSVEHKGGIEVKSEARVFKDAKLVKIGERYFVRGVGYVGKKYESDADANWYVGVDCAVSCRQGARANVVFIGRIPTLKRP